jgi:hypothetical protein
METEQHILKYQVVTEEIRREIQKFLESKEKWKQDLPESMGYSKGSAKRTFIAWST